MNIKIVLSAAALAGVLALGAPAFAQDKPMDKSMDKPMHHHAMHHHMHHMHHAAMHHEHAMHHMNHMHHDMSSDAKERAETRRLNEEQLHKGM